MVCIGDCWELDYNEHGHWSEYSEKNVRISRVNQGKCNVPLSRKPVEILLVRGVH